MPVSERGDNQAAQRSDWHPSKKKGAPRLDASEKRKHSILTRVNAKELGQVTRLASRLNLSRSGAIRHAIDALDAATDGRRDVASAGRAADRETLSALALVRSEINRVGVNVNQISRGLNRSGSVIEHTDAMLLIVALEGLSTSLESVTDDLKVRP